MIELQLDSYVLSEAIGQTVPISLHSSFYIAYKKLRKWIRRFPLSFDDTVINDLVLFYSLAKKKHLDHRAPNHLLRLVLSIYHMQKKLLSLSAMASHSRHLMVRWLPTDLLFPFSSKPVAGCVIGFNMMDRCELFDEENIIVALQKHFPELQLVKESYYRHHSQHENLRMFYFEIEKKNGFPFAFSEGKQMRINLEEKLRNSIQRLVPSVFMKLNQEEVYKNVLILSEEISSVDDIPQVYITLDRYSGREVVFYVSLVQVSLATKFSFKEGLFGCSFVLERIVPVRHLNGCPIEAHLFRLCLPCDSSLLRSDGSLDFYAARQRVVSILTTAIGEFRDYNGGLLIKQQELLYSFKETLPEIALSDSELMETFFHAIVPLEKQALLDPKILSSLFMFFREHRVDKTEEPFSIHIRREQKHLLLSVRILDSSIASVISSVLHNDLTHLKDWAYNILDMTGASFFNCVISHGVEERIEVFLQALQDSLDNWAQLRKSQQHLRIALSHPVLSLDPRVGGDSVSSNVLRLLFEGLTRFDEEGRVENAVAESIEVSADLRRYTFRLRSCFWNDGSPVSAYDFAYAWKKILSPDFKTSFAILFYPIKNARKAKEGTVSIEEVGILALNDRTLQVDLTLPTPYFLQMTAHPILSPVHRFIDQEFPQWPYQSEKYYPCNGPFQLKLNQLHQGYQLIKNPLYWDASQIRLDQIMLIPMDPFQASQAFVKKEIDWVGNPFGGWNSFYVPKDQGRILTSQNDWVNWLVFNTRVPPFNHPKIRAALALGIDRSELIAGLTLTDAPVTLTPAYSVLLPRYCENRPPVFPYCNVEKALCLLEEGMREIGCTKADLAIQLLFHHVGIQETIAVALKKQLKEKLGIECQLYPYSWNSFFQRMSEGKFQTGLLYWTTLVDDPIYTLNAFKFAKEGVNFSQWEHPDFQSCLDLSEKETSPFQRSMHLMKAEAILSQEVPVTPLFYRPSHAVIREDFYVQPNNASSGYFNIARGYSIRR